MRTTGNQVGSFGQDRALTREMRIGRVLFAGSLAALGALSLWSGDFALDWQPVPATIPWRQELAQASGLVLLASGLAALWRRTAVIAISVLTLNVAIWLCLLQLPRVIMRPTAAVRWLGFAETLMMVAGGFILAVSMTPSVSRDTILRFARLSFAAALPVVGLSHFVYVDATAALVPSWLPNRVAIAYVTGAAHMAAGLGLIVPAVARLAAVSEAAMIGSFTLLVWVPRVSASPSSRAQWTALLASSVLTGAASVVAGSLPSGTGARGAR